MTSSAPLFPPRGHPQVPKRPRRRQLPRPPGLEVLEVSDRGVRSRLAVRPEVMAPNGFLHAATVVALADTSCGYGCLAFLPQGASGFTTIELKSNFLGTARDGAIACHARPVHL